MKFNVDKILKHLNSARIEARNLFDKNNDSLDKLYLHKLVLSEKDEEKMGPFLDRNDFLFDIIQEIDAIIMDINEKIHHIPKE